MNLKDKLTRLMETSPPREIKICGTVYKILYMSNAEMVHRAILSNSWYPLYFENIVIAGACDIKHKVIVINKERVASKRLRTLVHEVCHAVCYEKYGFTR